MSRRTERLASTIQQELAQMIMRDVSDPRLPPEGMPSITRVKVSEDLSVADVFVTIMGTEGQQSAGLNALRHSAGMMRTKLSKMLSMRTTPYIKFHIDETLKKEMAVLDLLHKVAEENAELDRQRAAAGGEVGGEAALGEAAVGEAAAGETAGAAPAEDAEAAARPENEDDQEEDDKSR